jgi:hypothetical protein
VLIAALGAIIVLASLARGVAGAARDLDRMLAATRRVRRRLRVRLGDAVDLLRSRSWPAASTR